MIQVYAEVNAMTEYEERGVEREDWLKRNQEWSEKDR